MHLISIAWNEKQTGTALVREAQNINSKSTPALSENEGNLVFIYDLEKSTSCIQVT